MSKDFEQAYKELAQNEIPDLWDRIEAGLREKSTPEKANGKFRKAKKAYWMPYAKAAAAVLCVALTIPAAILLGQSEKGYNTQATTDAESAAEEAGGAIMEESIEESMEESMEESIEEAVPEESRDEILKQQMQAVEAAEEEAADTGGMENADIMEDREESSLLETKREMSSASDASDRNMKADSLSSAKEEKSIEDGRIIENIKVQITDVIFDQSYDTDNAGTVYTAVIYKDESGFFEEGEEIQILVPVHSSVLLMTDMRYEVDVACRSNEKYSFLLSGVPRQTEEGDS